MRVLALFVVVVGAAACKFPELPPVEGDDDGGSNIDATDANLALPQPLTVTVAGNGSVSSEPNGIACPTDCDNDFDPLSSVTLTAAAGAGAFFEGWSGDCTGSGDCTVTM